MTPTPRILFAGTHDIAAIFLDKLQPHYPVEMVLTAPDKPQGRGKQTLPSPVKRIAEKYQIPLYQPEKLTPDVIQTLTQEKLATPPDIWFVVAYGLLIPESLLQWPKRGCINAHVSLLPRWRGASPVIQAILAGDQETGVSLMQMDKGLDTGPILVQGTLPLSGSETTPELSQQLAELGAALAIQHLPDFLAGKILPQPQDNTYATYAHKLNKQNGLIQWEQEAIQIARAVRAFTPWPGTFSFIEHQRVKIIHASVQDNPLITSSTLPAGTILSSCKDHIEVQTGRGILRIDQLQFDGGKPLPIQALLNGNRKHLLQSGQRFTNE